LYSSPKDGLNAVLGIGIFPLLGIHNCCTSHAYLVFFV